MSELHDYLAAATQKSCDQLLEALAALPEERRGWQPGPKARTALDQMAECAVINGYVEPLLRTRQWPSSGREDFLARKSALTDGTEEALRARLQESTREAIAAFRAVPAEALGETVSLPWGDETMADVILFSYWNMTYHLGQINYIKSLVPDAE